MSISIQTNVNAMVAQENLRANTDFQSRTIERLTSGYRINSSGDDAAGLAVANKFRADTAELAQGVRNANDGISMLQIIDGGANNVSKILDRMKTLATQAASSTFTGNRTTLDTEFQALKGEIDRQAANVGLNGNGANNTLMSVYIGGGGSNQSNAKVTVDLSGTGNKIDTSGLGVAGNSLLAGGTQATATGINLTVAGLVNLNGSGTQTFTFQLGTGSVVATVTAGANGLSTDAAISQLNQTLNGSGISAFVDSATGYLFFSSGSAYTLQVGNASNGTGLATGGQFSDNTGMYRQNGAAAYVNIADAAHAVNLDFVKDGLTTRVNLDATTGANIGAALSTLNNALASKGIVALRDANGADGITFQSNGAFTVASTATTTQGQGVFTADQVATAATAPAAGSSATANALTAITALSSAVTNLGSVQGKIGAGQNKLQYAINLAQSQISGFSAAESRIRDTDVASEAANLTKAQVLVQASMAAMAQANSAPQAVLSLLRG